VVISSNESLKVNCNVLNPFLVWVTWLCKLMCIVVHFSPLNLLLFRLKEIFWFELIFQTFFQFLFYDLTIISIHLTFLWIYHLLKWNPQNYLITRQTNMCWSDEGTMVELCYFYIVHLFLAANFIMLAWVLFMHTMGLQCSKLWPWGTRT
jgi:hypothetical protein